MQIVPIVFSSSTSVVIVVASFVVSSIIAPNVRSFYHSSLITPFVNDFVHRRDWKKRILYSFLANDDEREHEKQTMVMMITVQR